MQIEKNKKYKKFKQNIKKGKKFKAKYKEFYKLPNRGVG